MAAERDISYSPLERDGFCDDAGGFSSSSLSDVDDDVDLPPRSKMISLFSALRIAVGFLTIACLVLLSFWGGWKLHSSECSYIVDTAWSKSLPNLANNHIPSHSVISLAFPEIKLLLT